LPFIKVEYIIIKMFK